MSCRFRLPGRRFAGARPHLAVIVVAGLAGWPAWAGPAPAPAPETAVAGPDEPVSLAEERARQIQALLDGSLDPAVDAEALFRIDVSDERLTGPEGARLRSVLSGLSGEKRDVADPLSAALGEFLARPAEERAELLASHARRREAAAAQADAGARVARERQAIEARVTQLRAYLDGTLDPAVDPAPLLTIDLTRDAEIGLDVDRRSAWLRAGAPAAGDGPAIEPEAPEVQALALARAELDALRRELLGKSPAEKQALAEAHRQRAAAATAEPEPEPDAAEQAREDGINEAERAAEEAAAERERALEAARRAKSEAKRVLAEERARLLGIKEAQARFRADLTRRRAEREENHNRALEWSRRVSDLAAAPRFAEEKSREADPIYEEIRSELARMRSLLKEELRHVRAAGAEVPRAGDDASERLPADLDRGDLPALRAELRAQQDELVALDREVAWELAQGLRDDVVLLNRARLDVLDMASDGLRAAVTGFGSDGVTQVGRELDQISVELAFRGLKLSSYRAGLGAQLRENRFQLGIRVLQLAFLLGAFVWWRRRAAHLLARLQEHLAGAEAPGRLHQVGGTALWFVRRIRKPLEWLLLLWAGSQLVGELRALPELNLVWLSALWILGGLTAIALVDALAARENMYAAGRRDTSELRIHSLRVVGLNVVAVGLILSLTTAMVGRGAIHGWVLSTCWLLSIPVGLYLVRRWRPIILERIQQEPAKSAFHEWVLAQDGAVGRFVAATAAAGYLLATGTASWVMRQLSGMEATRRLLAYLFRREVARRAAATEADDRFHPVAEEVRALFRPDDASDIELAEVAGEQLERVAALAAAPRPTLTAVVGERGSGKSRFLARIARTVHGVPVKLVQCPEAGLEGLWKELAEMIDRPALRGSELQTALRGMGPLVIAVDDVQRLVVPAVNGLASLDRFTTFAREVEGQVSWVVGVDVAAWQFVRRARAERVFFEQVVTLPRWTEHELGELIRRRCEAGGFEPSFEGLVVPRQAAQPLPDGGDRVQAGYYRLLWDFSNGNPAVALHAFGESLFLADDGRMVVRLFREPAPQEIEDLPLPVLFVLRAAVQLEFASAREVAAATQLDLEEIEHAFRFCKARGYLEELGEGVRLSWPWFRTITTVLRRQHLLTAS